MQYSITLIMDAVHLRLLHKNGVQTGGTYSEEICAVQTGGTYSEAICSDLSSILLHFVYNQQKMNEISKYYALSLLYKNYDINFLINIMKTKTNERLSFVKQKQINENTRISAEKNECISF